VDCGVWQHIEVLEVVVYIECEVQNRVDVDLEIDSLAGVDFVVNVGVDFGLDFEFRIDIELQVFPVDIEVHMEVEVDHMVCFEVEVGNIQVVVFVRFLVVFGIEVYCHSQVDVQLPANIELYVEIRTLGVVVSTGVEIEDYFELVEAMLQL
jgi:hypothetical protein